jgi:hypothetical protein
MELGTCEMGQTAPERSGRSWDRGQPEKELGCDAVLHTAGEEINDMWGQGGQYLPIFLPLGAVDVNLWLIGAIYLQITALCYFTGIRAI